MTPEVGPGAGPRLPRQARSQATRRTLLMAAGERFAVQGFHGTALRELVGDGAATKGAFYFHFASKQAVAEALVAAMTESWDQVVAAVRYAADDGLEALVLLTDAVTVRFGDPVVRGAGRILRDNVVSSPTLAEVTGWWRDRAEEMLVEAQGAGLLRDAADPAWVAREVVHGFAGRATVIEAAGAPESLWESMNEFWAGLLPLVATDAWCTRWVRRRGPQRCRPVGVGLQGIEHLEVRALGEPGGT